MYSHFATEPFSSTSPSKMGLAKSFSNKIKRGLSIRSSSAVFESEKSLKSPFRPTISLPLERPEFVDAKEITTTHVQSYGGIGWKTVDATPPSPTTSSTSSSAHQSYLSSPASSRGSTSSRTSYNSADDGYFPAMEKKVSFSIDTTIIPRRDKTASVSSSVYGSEGELPPPIEDDEEIMQKMGELRFSAAEYIEEIEGTPMIIVDGKLYL